jgi:hypothetical protein
MEAIKLLDEISKGIGNEHYKLFHIWTTQMIFSWRWWLLVILTILPWIVWIKIRDKKDTARLLFIGLIVMLVTGTLDTIGIDYNAWHYDWQLFPINVSFPWNYSLFPVGVMLILQFNPQINKYIKALVFSFFTAFLFTQPFIWLGMYDRQSWESWYSFVIYVPLYLFFNYVYESNLFYKQ